MLKRNHGTRIVSGTKRSLSCFMCYACFSGDAPNRVKPDKLEFMSIRSSIYNLIDTLIYGGSSEGPGKSSMSAEVFPTR